MELLFYQHIEEFVLSCEDRSLKKNRSEEKSEEK